MIRACGLSDTGRVRKSNEDRFVADAELNLYAVADGMGGHRAGEVASKLAIEALTAFIRISVTDMDVTWPYGIDPKLSLDANRLRTGIYLANRRVFRASESSDDYAGMGTTMVSVLIDGTQAAIAWVGDSRVYLISQGAIEQLTVDDSWAARILSQESGLAPEEVARHPMRHVLTNVVGARDTVDVHVVERSLGENDTLLLCTDGLHNVVQAAMMLQIVGTTPNVDSAAQALIDKAIELGTRDNVTALVIRNKGNQWPRPRATQRIKHLSRRVAVKLMLGDFDQDPELRARFQSRPWAPPSKILQELQNAEEAAYAAMRDGAQDALRPAAPGETEPRGWRPVWQPCGEELQTTP